MPSLDQGDHAYIEFDRKLVNPTAVASDKGYRISGYRVEFKGICSTCWAMLNKREDGDKQ
ncbi:MAG: hypothetical protein EX260_09235 [Desulfobulbaceae bacterium]|nr:MAG: hypothetical protein EX260_09235 [Desulfobulbaceae bacterium]